MKKRIPSWTKNSTKELGLHIGTWRRMRGMTQADLASRTGISRETLSRLENGDGSVSINTLLTVLHVFDVSDKLVDATNPYNTPFGMARADTALPKRIVGARSRKAQP